MVTLHFSAKKFMKKEGRYMTESEKTNHWSEKLDGHPVVFEHKDDPIGRFPCCKMICLKAWCVK